ncbi:MAG: RNA polymerase sigma factor [Pirellulales bacterium]
MFSNFALQPWVAILDLSDEELIERFREQGNHSSLDALVRRHLPRVRALIYPLVGRSQTVDDLTQETFLRAIRSLDSFKGSSRFGTWLARIAINVVRDHHRSARRRVQINTTPEIEVVAECPAPEDRVRDEERDSKIHSAILELPEAMREAVSLVCIQGYSPSDAAEITASNLATVYWRIHQSRKRLKEKLADYL